MISVRVDLRRGLRTPMIAAALGVVLIATFPPGAAAHHDEVVDKLEQGTTSLVSRSSSGVEGDANSGDGGGSGCPPGGQYSASDNGRFVAFASRAGNLHPGDVNGQVLYDVFVHDRKKQKTDLVSALPSGLGPEPPVLPDIPIEVSHCLVASHSPAISGNGRYVAFISNLPLTGVEEIPEQGAPLFKVFLRDLKKHTTELVSVTWDGNPATGSSGMPEGRGGRTGLSISDNGRFVAFTSSASNILDGVCPSPELAPGVTSPVSIPCGQTYVRDRKEKETILISKSSSGEPANHLSDDPSMSGNGRFVVFESEANNLVPADLNQCPQTFNSVFPPPPSCLDVFLHDLETGETELISISRDGIPGSDASRVGKWGSGSQTVSDDGRFVLFTSTAIDLVPANHHLSPGLSAGGYVRDRRTGRTERVSVSSTGAILQSNNFGFHSVTDDGRHVQLNQHLMNDIYFGPAPDGGPYTPRDQGHEDRGTFLYDRKSGQVDWVLFNLKNGSQDGAPPGTDMVVGDVGGNGRFIVGASDRIDGVPEDIYNVYIRDLGDRPLGADPIDAGTSSRGISLPGRPAMAGSSVITATGSSGGLIPGMGGQILEARIVHRPALNDLFLRIEVDRLPTIGSVPEAGILYGARLEVAEKSYELRAQGFGGPPDQGGGLFGLFDCTGRACTEVAQVPGGYGTVGENIVAAIPLQHLGLERGGRIRDLEVFAGPGTYLSGTNLIDDRLRMH